MAQLVQLLGSVVHRPALLVLDEPFSVLDPVNQEKLEALIANQLPDAEKRRRADFIVDSSQGLDAARAQVAEILRKVATMTKRRR